MNEISIDGVDVIVRFHNPAYFDELGAAVMSLIGQSWRPLRVLLVTQRFNSDQLRELDSKLSVFRNIDPSISLDLLPYNRDEGLQDARSAVLNKGIAHAKGRYLAVLDYDDVLYPDAYAILVHELQASASAVAFGGIALKCIATSHAVPMGIAFAKLGRPAGSGILDTFRAPFCPFHGMLIDRSRVAPEDLRIDESLPVFEDYELHLRLGTRYPFSYRALSHVIGEYRYRDDGSNTVPLRTDIDAQKQKLWNFYSREMERRRRQLIISPDIQARLGIDPMIPDLTIRGLLDLIDRGDWTPSADTDSTLLPRVPAYSSALVRI